MEWNVLYLIGPLPETDKGIKCKLVRGDYFTKWVESYALPDGQDTTVVDAFVTNFVFCFGIPRELHSDQGSELPVVGVLQHMHDLRHPQDPYNCKQSEVRRRDLTRSLLNAISIMLDP